MKLQRRFYAITSEESDKLLSMYNRGDWKDLKNFTESKENIIFKTFKVISKKFLENEEKIDTREEFEYIIEMEEKNPEVYFSKGLCYYILNRIFDAEEEFQKSKEIAMSNYMLGELSKISKSESISFYQKAADMGLKQAFVSIGILYFDKKEYDNALKTFLKIPEYDEAQYHLGELYLKGLGVTKNPQKALDYFKQSSMQGNPKALFEMAKMMIKSNNKHGIEILKESAKRMNPNAIYYLANLYIQGENVEKNESKGIELLKRATELGQPEALFELGKRYHKGIGIEKDVNLAIQILTEAINKGMLPANVYLAKIYLAGFDVLQDLKKGFELIKEAADENYSDAQYELAMLYLEGEGCKEDDQLAYEYFEKAGKAGHPEANFYLGKYYEKIPEFYQTAIDCYNKAAVHGKLKAFETLASHYEMGDIVEKNDELAFKYLCLGAQAGDDISQFHLGINFLKGIGTQKNPEQAILWLKKSAEQNLHQAQATLGVIYLNGIEVDIDKEIGVEWLKKAANNQNKDAQLILGEMGIKFY